MKMKLCVAGFLLLVLCADIHLHAQQPEADRKQFEETKAKAEIGDAEAQFIIGWDYWTGTGVDRDLVEAVKWYRKAAEQNNAAAQYNLGKCFFDGQGVVRNMAEAVKWYMKAAEQNLAWAQCNLGQCYRNGQGVAKDEVEAVKWLRKGCNAGDTFACEEIQKKFH